MARPPCEELDFHPICFTDRLNYTVNHGCSLPYNRPGIPDVAQVYHRPTLPSILLPQRAAEVACKANDSGIGPLIVWRSRWPYNYMEFVSRVLAAAPFLLTKSKATVLVPGLLYPTPSFYDDILGVMGHRMVYSGPEYLSKHRYTSAMICCVNGRGSLNVSAVNVLTSLIMRRHSVAPPLQSIRSLELSSSTVAIIDRASLASPKIGRRRAIVNVQELLDRCAQRAGRCTRLRFPPETAFATVLAALRDVHVLCGMHGAGLTNTIFMRHGATLVEILPKAFAAPGSFGMDKFTFIAELGYRHVQLTADEAFQECVNSAHGVFELLRDCDVVLSWAAVEQALYAEAIPIAPAITPAITRTTTPALKMGAAAPLLWHCTDWPAGPEAGSDEARCLHGNTRNDGFLYVHNRHRGSASAICGKSAKCTCCRQPARLHLRATTHKRL